MRCIGCRDRWIVPMFVLLLVSLRGGGGGGVMMRGAVMDAVMLIVRMSSGVGFAALFETP